MIRRSAIRSLSQADDVLAIMHQGNGANQIGVDTLTGEVKYGGQMMGTFTGGTSGNPLVVSFTTSAATPAATQALLRRMAYRNSGDNPGTAMRTITFTLNDGSSGSDNAYAAVNVVPTNDVLGIKWGSSITVDAEAATVSYAGTLMAATPAAPAPLR